MTGCWNLQEEWVKSHHLDSVRGVYQTPQGTGWSGLMDNKWLISQDMQQKDVVKEEESIFILGEVSRSAQSVTEWVHIWQSSRCGFLVWSMSQLEQGSWGRAWTDERWAQHFAQLIGSSKAPLPPLVPCEWRQSEKWGCRGQNPWVRPSVWKKVII